MLRDIEFLNSGLDFSVYRAYSIMFGNIAVKVPLKRWILNDNDGCIDARKVLQQEVQLIKHLKQYAIPVPEIYSLNIDERGIDFLASEYIENDQSTPRSYELGCLIKSIHCSDIPSFSLIAQENCTFAEVLAERMYRRSKVIERITNIQLDIPHANKLKEIFDIDTPICLLHMDVRPENILTEEGNIEGIIDWSNAIIGDPRLELARIAEYGLLNNEFLDGYGQPDCFKNIPKYIELLYRLDTVIMLAIVFLLESPISGIARNYLNRLIELSAKVNKYFHNH